MIKKNRVVAHSIIRRSNRGIVKIPYSWKS